VAIEQLPPACTGHRPDRRLAGVSRMAVHRPPPGRYRRPGTRQRGIPGARGQRPARPGGSARRCHRDAVRIRHRMRADHTHLRSTLPPRKLRPWTTGNGPLHATCSHQNCGQPASPALRGLPGHHGPQRRGQPAAGARYKTQIHNGAIGAPPAIRVAGTSRASTRRSLESHSEIASGSGNSASWTCP
jgi:hypothetical protein